MRKSCKYCGRTHPAGEVCRLKPAPKYNYDRSDAKVRRFRNSFEWRKKRAEIRERDNYLCRVCFSLGRMTHHGISVHHIESLSDRFDLRLRDDNLLSLCEEHHRAADSGKFTRKHLKNMTKQSTPLHRGAKRKPNGATPTAKIV